MPEPNQPREGEIAFAISVGTLYDLTIGKIGWPVRFTQHSHPTKATLTLRNRTPGGPVLVILDSSSPYDPEHPELHPPVLSLNENGFTQLKVGGYIDFAYQAVGYPPNPGVGVPALRMYARGGRVYIKAAGGGEEMLPFGPPPGSNWGWSYWMSGG